MARIVYGADTPAEIRAAVEPIIERWRWLIPAWCYEVAIYFQERGEPGQPRSVASHAADTEYRQASLRVNPTWLTEPADSRERHLVHELVHNLLNVQDDAHWRALETLKRMKYPGYLEAKEARRVALEGAVSDLTEVLWNRCRLPAGQGE